MERKKALGFAATITAITASAAFAIGANFGLFGAQATSASAGPLPISAVGESAETTSPVAPTAEGDDVTEQVRVIDVPIRLPLPAATEAPPASLTAEDPFDVAAADDDEESPDDEGLATPDASPEPADDGDPPTTDEASDGDDDHSEEDATEQEPCEVHDDGLVECHEHDDD